MAKKIQNGNVNYYLNNKDFYVSILEWRKTEEETGIKKIPDKIAMSFVKICENLAKSGRFAGYTWRSEMISDAILSCIQYCRNFNPEKSQNPFAFYTQIAYNAFVQRIKIEKEKLNTRIEYTKYMDMLYDIPTEFDEDGDQFENVNRRGVTFTENIAKNEVKNSVKVKKPFSRAQVEARKNKPKKYTIDDFSEEL